MDSGDVFIDEIWSFDVIQQGDSGLVNQNKLGMLCECLIKVSMQLSSQSLLHLTVDWKDNARDFLNFFTRYLPDLSASAQSSLPTYLTRVPQSISEDRRLRGFIDRELVTICHSFSGTSS